MTKQTGPIARTFLAAQSDERLVRLLRDGHEQAFDEIVRRYRGPLVGFATAIVGHDRSEDAVQTALENAHRALLAGDREINLRPWLFTIVRNGSLNLIRSEPATDELNPLLSSNAGSDPEQVAERNEEMDRLFTAICALPNAQREALVRRELEGVGHGEIAAQLGTTATAVRGLIFRARTGVRNAMGALVPLPVLRTLLAQGSAAGVASGGGAAALFGGAGAKGGAAVAAAVVALGAGIAIEKHHGGNHGGDVGVAQAAEGSAGSHGGTTSPRTAAGRTPPHVGDSTAAGNGGAGGEGPAQGGHEAGGRSTSAGGPGSSGPVSSGSGSSGSGHSGSGEDHSGPSGSTTEPPEIDDDNSGPGGGSSGSNGHESSGHEVEVEEPEAPEPEEPELGSSGPAHGIEAPDDDRASDGRSERGTAMTSGSAA